MVCRYWNIYGQIFFSHKQKSLLQSNHNFQVFFLISFIIHIELNPGPKKKSHSYFSCCHWNINSLPIDNYCKVAALKAYNSVQKYDFLCVGKTFLNSSFESNDKDLMIESYNLIWSYHPSNTKRGGVCI